MSSIKNIAKSFALNPVRYTKINNVFVIDSDSGLFVLKEKTRDDLDDLFAYLHSRSYTNYLQPKSTTDYHLFPYIKETNIPDEQKMLDLAYTLATLHAKTAYNKEVDLDDYKLIYEHEKNDLLLLKKFYDQLINDIELQEYMSPYEYLTALNINKISASIAYGLDCLERWYNQVKDKYKMRYCRLYGKADLDHFIVGDHDMYLINWNNSSEGIGIYDIVNFYRTHFLNCDLVSFIEMYEKIYPINEDEWVLLEELLVKPTALMIQDNEYQMCVEVSRLVDYLYKTEKLIVSLREIKTKNKAHN